MPPSETLLPNTTKGFLSVPDVQLLRERWNETQLGHMTQDPVMQPFVDDLRDQIKSKLSSSQVRLGLTVDDLEGIYGGELCLAKLQPANDIDQHATILLVDVTGHVQQAEAVVEKAGKNLLEQGAQKRVARIEGVDVTVFTIPKRRQDTPTVEAYHVIHKDALLVSDHEGMVQHVIAQLNGAGGQNLAQLDAFVTTLGRCQRESGDMVPHIRWFVDPFAYAQTMRAAAGGRKKKGADLLRVLPNQGFDAIRGVGGYVFLAVGDQEILHRTMVFAPPVQGSADQPPSARYALAARMLDFPNTESLQPQGFVSRDLGSYFSFNWKMIPAFEYAKTLVNEMLGGGKDDDLMEEVIVGLARDKDGPQVDLRKDLVHHFAERVSMITDCRRPITPDSERLMVTVELTNPEAVRAAVDKAFNADPEAQKREFEGQVIWEIIKDESPVEVEELQIDDGGMGVFDPFDQGNVPEEPEEEEQETKILPNSAITVVHDHLVIASHVDFIVEMLQRPVGTDLLSDAADFQQVQDALAKIGAGSSSFRFFARTDETYRPTYELIRDGKMPEAKTLLGRLLNQLLGPDEKGILREQQIDGAKMPEFDAVRRYLGPSGMYVQSEGEGWYMAGCLLSKTVRLAEAPATK